MRLRNWLLATLVAAPLSTMGVTVRSEMLADLPQHTHYHGIAFSRSGSAVLLLATHHGLFAVDKNGTATRVSPVQDFMGFSPDSTDPLRYYASGHPASGGNSGFLRSTDGGASWKQLSEGVGGPVDFHQMDVSLANPKVIYGSYGNIQVSRDGGNTWSVAGDPPPGLIALAASSLNDRQLYAATEKGLYVSEDTGATWSVTSFEDQVVSMIENGPDGLLYAFVVGKGLASTNENNLDAWTFLSLDFGDSIPLHFAVNELNHQHLALTTHKSEVLESVNGGRTWHPFGAEQ
jgi:photosystem II stability/assembly factor-like uncharacterized protein